MRRRKFIALLGGAAAACQAVMLLAIPGCSLDNSASALDRSLFSVPGASMHRDTQRRRDLERVNEVTELAGEYLDCVSGGPGGVVGLEGNDALTASMTDIGGQGSVLSQTLYSARMSSLKT